MEPRIQKGTLVVVLNFPVGEYWDPAGDFIGIVRERLGNDDLLVDGGPNHGSRLGVHEKNLIPLAEISSKDQDLTAEEALRKYLPEVIITLARKTFEIPLVAQKKEG